LRVLVILACSLAFPARRVLEKIPIQGKGRSFQGEEIKMKGVPSWVRGG